MIGQRNSNSDSNETVLYVPGWWVRSFERTQGQHIREPGAAGGPQFRALPIGDADSQSQLALLLDLIQRKLRDLSGSRTKDISLSWQEYLTHFSLAASSRAGLRDVFESIGSISLAAQHDDQLQVLPLFCESFIRWEGDSGSEWTLKVDSRTQELISGFSDGHLDFGRALRAEPCSQFVLRDDPPLSLWRAAWLEMRDVDRLLYLNLEKAMQWRMSLLHLEGVFSASIEELFEGIELLRDDAEASTLIARLRVLGRVGTSLVEHGVMKHDPQTSFYASSSELLAGLPAIIWQGSTARLDNEASSRFTAELFEQMRLSVAAEELHSLWEVIAPRARNVGIEFKRLWAMISEHSGGVLRVGPTRILQAHSLFFEWALRRPAISDIPLADELRAKELFAACRLQGDIVADFKKFLSILSEPCTARFIAENSTLSIGQSDLRSETSLVLALRDTIQRKNASPTAMTRDNLAAMPLENSAPSAKPSAAVAEILSDQPQTRLLSLAESKMIRIAHDELEKMYKSDAKAYESLRNNYLKSLEDNQRSLMQDFQRRMKPGIFEQQLKQRLVRYMVSNPGEWKSSRSLLL